VIVSDHDNDSVGGLEDLDLACSRSCVDVSLPRVEMGLIVRAKATDELYSVVTNYIISA
jgi:hypothetical protein